jgi:hypothetical protein
MLCQGHCSLSVAVDNDADLLVSTPSQSCTMLVVYIK